jgi:hypothetical protein
VNFLSFINSVRTFDAADAPGIAQKLFIEMVKKNIYRIEVFLLGKSVFGKQAPGI